MFAVALLEGGVGSVPYAYCREHCVTGVFRELFTERKMSMSGDDKKKREHNTISGITIIIGIVLLLFGSIPFGVIFLIIGFGSLLMTIAEK